MTSRSLAIPVSEHFDTIGPIARTVKDAAYVLATIAGKDPYDDNTSEIPFKKIPDYVAACKMSSLKGARIGIPRNVLNSYIGFGVDSSVIAAFEAAIATMKKAGAIIVDNTDYPAWEVYLNDPASLPFVFGTDFITDLPKYLAQLTKNPQNIHNLADVQNFTINSALE